MTQKNMGEIFKRLLTAQIQTRRVLQLRIDTNSFSEYPKSY